MNRKKSSFKQATKSLFLKYTVIPILFVIILFILFTVFLFKVKTVHDTNQAAAIIKDEINGVFEEYIQEINRMSESNVVRQLLVTRRKGHLVYEEFYNFNNRQQVKSAFYLVDRNHIFLASTNGNDEGILKGNLSGINKKPEDIYIDVSRTNLSHGKTAAITFGKAVIIEGQIKGYILYRLYEEDLQNLIFGHKADIVVITDEYDNIIVTSNEVVRGLMNKFKPEYTGKTTVKVKDILYYVKKSEQKTIPFKLYTLTSKKGDPIIWWIYLGFLIIIGGSLYFLLKNSAEKMSTKNGESIGKLMNAVSRLEKGDLKSYVDIKTGDEFEVFADQYNLMLDNLNKLMETNKELSDIRRINEIKLLQSQFNPHFLFNILETIRYMMFADVGTAQEIIISLSRLLRYSLNNQMDVEKLDKDLQYTIDYLQLHKHRFNNRLKYDIEMPEEAKQVYVPRLLLQPIIENSINYGYASQMELNIKIQGELDTDVIKLTVTDDGGGITENDLKRIREQLNASQNEGTSIGLYNTHRRIKLQYGQDYGITIHSEIGKGTKVEITIPVRKGDEPHV